MLLYIVLNCGLVPWIADFFAISNKPTIEKHISVFSIKWFTNELLFKLEVITIELGFSKNFKKTSAAFLSYEISRLLSGVSTI